MILSCKVRVFLNCISFCDDVGTTSNPSWWNQNYRLRTAEMLSVHKNRTPCEDIHPVYTLFHPFVAAAQVWRTTLISARHPVLQIIFIHTQIYVHIYTRRIHLNVKKNTTPFADTDLSRICFSSSAISIISNIDIRSAYNLQLHDTHVKYYFQMSFIQITYD